MKNSQLTQQLKLNPQKSAIISLVLGSISILPIIVCLIISFFPTIAFRFFGPPQELSLLMAYGAILFVLTKFFPLFFLFSIGGLIFGIKGLKATKKVFAKIGIIFSIIGLGGIILGLGISYYLGFK